ncbi:MAG: 23S rRNA (uracil(1939)-C(5))-methyltransferase RlmD, partial [Gammaproteobacteria bacterium]|nr:23S rRNA (uracil(1939)-C(5))-methyltransferase RlmD [Gammaproteobacteria bacterium]
SRRKKIPSDPQPAHIDSLSHEGRGIASIAGKTTFIHGALPGEDVMFRYSNRRAKFDEGYIVEVIKASGDRKTPECPHFGVCGGCSLQHMENDAQLQHKQQVLLDQFEHIGHVKPESLFEPITGPVQGYRRKARLGVKFVAKKDKVLVGFREIYSRFVADIDRCMVLHPAVGEKLLALQALIQGLSIFRQLPQLEVAVSDDLTVLVLRHLQPLTSDDRDRLIEFETQHDVIFFLQPKGPDSVVKLSDDEFPGLRYRLPDHDIEIVFQATDFTQVNMEINRQMINRVLDLFELNNQDRVLDLFCGLGNFTLPVAKYCGHVTGVEADPGLIERARFNAMHNGLDNTEFVVANLMDETLEAAFLHERFNKVLLDPPRSGAREIIERLDLSNTEILVYVSCNPATLALDAGILVHQKKLRLVGAGIMDMFPHTSHVESIALFQPE